MPERWEELLELNDLAICAPVRLELLYSARSRAEYRSLQQDLARLPNLELVGRVERAALDAHSALGERSQQRGPAPIDLLIAAVAEVNDVTLLHYDRHFDLIARATGQDAEWLAPRGTLD